jgi:hypothetical protein
MSSEDLLLLHLLPVVGELILEVGDQHTELEHNKNK